MTFPCKTAEYYYKISFLAFVLGSPNFWIENLNVSKTFYKLYRTITKCFNAIMIPFICFELGAFITQKNLTNKQESDLLIYGISHPILWSYNWIIWSHVEDVKRLFKLILKLKSVYNDVKVEDMMLRKAKRDSMALALSCIMSVVLHSIEALMHFIKSGLINFLFIVSINWGKRGLRAEGTFTTVITTWPLVDDPSPNAHAVRMISYVLWWVLVSRIIATYTVVIGLVTSISHQYTNLQSYFYSIEAIFKESNLSQREKEIKYEKSFKLGIKWHSDTIESVKQCRNICKGIFSGQIVFVILMLVFLMTQMMKSERTMVTAAATAITATAVLISTGFLLWNAGDITVEASKLATAMYSSGWHNCQGQTAFGIRKLVVISMTHAQKPVVIKALGMMTLSYRSYLTLVKSSYSVFSVIY